MRRLAFSGALSALVLALPLATLSCSNAGPAGGDPSGAISSPISNGQLDSGAHPAVVFVQAVMGFESFSCSGTIFQTDVPNNVGYVITAAHCVRGDMGSPDPTPAEMSIVTGDDGNNQNPMTTHQVLSFAYQPGANPPEYDVAIIKFKGVTASTPTLPLSTPELDVDLADGQEMQVVGFGEHAPNQDDGKKRNVLLNLGAVDTYDAVDDLTIAAPLGPMQQATCEGDSGGPWLRTINGQQYVVAVTSIGVGGDCLPTSDGGVAARVSPFLTSLIGNFIAGNPVAQTCNECTTAIESTSCVAQATACSKIIDCYEKAERCGCLLNDDACFQTCLTNRPKGADEYAALQACFCETSNCNAECAPTTCTASGTGGSGGGGGSGGASSTGGAGGDAAGGASAGTGGAGGDSEGGAGGASEAGGAGGASSGGTPGTGGNSVSGSGGSGPAGMTGSGATGGAIGTGGTASAAGGGATKGGAGGVVTGSTGGTSAAGTSTSGADSATSPSDSSGGCEVSVPAKSTEKMGAFFLLGLLGLSGLRRGKRADDLVQPERRGAPEPG